MMRKHKIVVLIAAGFFLLLGSSFTGVLHRYYVSLTEVNINTEKHTLNVSIKLFADDLELELEKSSGKKVKLSESMEDIQKKTLVEYFQKNFKINVGGKLLDLEFVGIEPESDSFWCYFEVAKFKGKGTVTVLNTVLYENFPEQSNLINVNWNGESKSHKLTNPDKFAEFSFQ